MSKKKHQKKKVQGQETKNMLREELKRHVSNDEYADALDVLAQMVQSGTKISADDMYDGAYCYFMSGDYERTAKWLDSVLAAEPAHVKARLLLARLCILEGRTDSAKRSTTGQTHCSHSVP